MAKNQDKGQRRQMNAVEVRNRILSYKSQLQINACWVEAIKNESKGRILNENFDFNPKNRKSIFISYRIFDSYCPF